MRWIKKKTGPAAQALKDKDALAEAEKAHEVVAVAYFKELKVRRLTARKCCDLCVGGRGCKAHEVVAVAYFKELKVRKQPGFSNPSSA